MKKYFLLTACILFTTSLLAQEVESDHQSVSSVSMDGATYNFSFVWKLRQKPHIKAHQPVVGFSFLNLQGLQDDVNLNLGRSYSFALGLGSFDLSLSQHWVVSSAFGFDWSRYHFKNDMSLQSFKNDPSQFLPDPEGRAYRDSKLLVYYATLPLVLEYQKKLGNHHYFFLQGGVEGLLKLYSKSKAVLDTRRKTTIDYRDLNITPLNCRLICRIGFGDFILFGYYQPFSLFPKGKGPEIYPYGIGIALTD
ncbi:MAG: hypothetical protein LBR66_04910 [Candidatus Symbiothrix sp.]|jgi:hypothetical protein|nr:hypothetical protein [Candidatus Symbiothrix sp.]